MRKPDPLLSIILHDTCEMGDNVGMCAGFERGNWRETALVEHVMEWLPEFALNYSELKTIQHHNAVRMSRRAANVVYKTEKYGNRGEFGEILLHIALRQVFDTIPAVSKIYYKSAVNKTVEGFDAVHVVFDGDELELWIGETKFYSNLARAVRDVCEEILDHLETDYLRDEFLLIRNKVDPDWPHADRLSKLLNENTSLDKIFARTVIPVLLTYNSVALSTHEKSTTDYESKVRKEFQKGFDSLRKKIAEGYVERFNMNLEVAINVIILPIKNKITLIRALHKRLKGLQG